MEFLADLPTRTLIFASLIGIALDILSGIARAVKNDELSSEKMRLGLWHKAGFIGLMILGIYVQWVQTAADIGAYLGFTLPAFSAVCVYVIATEVLSIAENLQELNPEIIDILHTQSDDEKELE